MLDEPARAARDTISRMWERAGDAATPGPRSGSLSPPDLTRLGNTTALKRSGTIEVPAMCSTLSVQQQT